MLTAFPQCNFSLEFPGIPSKILYIMSVISDHDFLSIKKIFNDLVTSLTECVSEFKIMHFGILINMPHCRYRMTQCESLQWHFQGQCTDILLHVLPVIVSFDTGYSATPSCITMPVFKRSIHAIPELNITIATSSYDQAVSDIHTPDVRSSGSEGRGGGRVTTAGGEGVCVGICVEWGIKGRM